MTLPDFENLLGDIAADATPDDSVTVTRAPGSIKHDLTTDETV